VIPELLICADIRVVVPTGTAYVAFALNFNIPLVEYHFCHHIADVLRSKKLPFVFVVQF
jgi:hypothetical protein